MIHLLVDDLVNQSKKLITDHQPQSIEDVRNSPPLIAFSEPIRRQVMELKSFLMKSPSTKPLTRL